MRRLAGGAGAVAEVGAEADTVLVLVAASIADLGSEGERCARDEEEEEPLLGRWMPSEGKERDFLLVL